MTQTVAKHLTGNEYKLRKETNRDENGDVTHEYFMDADSGIIYADTDSVPGDTKITINGVTMTIADAYLASKSVIHIGEKQYAMPQNWLSPVLVENDVIEKPVKYVYRHKVRKAKWRITLQTGESVIVTNDHSIMVKRDGKLIEVKPSGINIMAEQCVKIVKAESNNFTHQEVGILSVEQLDDFEDEYVYDLVMEDGNYPYFVANGILVHNSNYFKTFTDNIEDAVKVADTVATVVNDSFPAFVIKAFNATNERSTVIKCAREIVGESALFFKVKKKYTIKVVDNEGKRCNKLKSMGSEIKRSDTPKIIQDFLKKLMNKILDGYEYTEIADFVNVQRKQLIFNNLNDLMAIGATKQINKFEHYLAAFKAKEKVTIPGHVRAAINYFLLSQENDDNPTIISSGDKMTVFYLKNTNSAYLRNMKTIAFPSDMETVPDWFVENFVVDTKLTSEKMIDSKIEGIFDAWGQPMPSEKQAVIQSAFIM